MCPPPFAQVQEQLKPKDHANQFAVQCAIPLHVRMQSTMSGLILADFNLAVGWSILQSAKFSCYMVSQVCAVGVWLGQDQPSTKLNLPTFLFTLVVANPPNFPAIWYLRINPRRMCRRVITVLVLCVRACLCVTNLHAAKSVYTAKWTYQLAVR